MFALIIVFAILTLLVFGVSVVAPKEYVDSARNTTHPRTIVRVIGAGFLALTLLFTLIGSVKSVSTKNVGIETAFGKVSGHLSNGIHLTAPWVNVTEMDAAIQTDSYTGKDCLDVRIANQQTACVDISIRWRIVPGAADSLFQNYRTFENVRDSLVTRELTSAVNNQLSNYNPLNSISVDVSTTTNYPKNPSLSQVSQDVTHQMQREIGSQIEVLNTIIPIMHFDSETQNRLNQLQQQEAQTRVAVAAQQTAQAQAVANQSLAASVDNSTNVLVSKCLDTLQQMVKDGQRVPVGFSCWPGGSSTSGVIVNSNQ